MASEAMSPQPANVAFDLAAMLASERDYAVRLCRSLSGSSDAAEDLAQETLIEAWRHRQRLVAPEGSRQWLAAIARNVCLRWQRRPGRDRAQLAALMAAGERGIAQLNLGTDLDRYELARLCDRALTLLPSEARTIVTMRCIEELPQAVVAARLGLGEGAVAMRLQRGKAALRRVLAADLGADAVACSLELPQPDGWRQTRLWRRMCGAQRLLGRLTGLPLAFELRCPICTPGSGVPLTQTRLPGFAGLTSYKAALTRVERWIDQEYGLNRKSETPRCPGCGRATPIRVDEGRSLPRELQMPGVHVYLQCGACGIWAHATLPGVVATSPEAQRFWRAHPRIRTLPERELDAPGRRIIVVSFESVTDSARLDMLIARDAVRLVTASGVPTV